MGLPQLEVRSWCQCTAVLLTMFTWNGGPRSSKLISSGSFCIHCVRLVSTPLNLAGLRCKYLRDWKHQPMEVQWPLKFSKKDKLDIYLFSGYSGALCWFIGTTFLKCWHWAIKKMKMYGCNDKSVLYDVCWSNRSTCGLSGMMSLPHGMSPKMYRENRDRTEVL